MSSSFNKPHIISTVLELFGPDLLPGNISSLLTPFSLETHFSRIMATGKKDKQRIEATLPAIMERLVELSMVTGLNISTDPKITLINHALADEAGNFIKETVAIYKMWLQQFEDIKAGKIGFDPTEHEREMMRIWAKRNYLRRDYQLLLGVSKETPTEYPEEFRKKWLH